MIEFGKTLRTARESKGYTVSQIAEMTHIKISAIEGLEKEDFSMIAAPIYGRGFVKLYCEVVGLEAKPLVDEFMAIVNGEHEIAIKERPVAGTEPPPDSAITPPLPPPQKLTAERDLFTQDESVEPVAAEQPPVSDPIPEAKQSAGISRYASSFRTEDRTSPVLPVLPWRLIVLGIAGLLLLAILAYGIRALYCATSTRSPAEIKPAEAEESEPPAAATAKPAARTRQQNIPSLYID